MKKSKLPLYEIISLIIGELMISAIICLVYFLIGDFSYKVVLGTLLGSVTTVLNFLYLSITASRAFDKVIEATAGQEMTEEEAAEFAEKNQAAVQNSLRLSYIVRNIVMIAVLIIAFLISHFDVIATLIPLACFRIIITVASLLKRKVSKD